MVDLETGHNGQTAVLHVDRDQNKDQGFVIHHTQLMAVETVLGIIKNKVYVKIDIVL